MEIKSRRLGPDKIQMATVKFDLNTDFSPLFNWNTKMIFASVLAEFVSKDNSTNSNVIWDDHILPQDTKIKLRNKRAEYPVYDISNELYSLDGNLVLQYEIVPWVGFFVTKRKVFEHKLKFPKK